MTLVEGRKLLKEFREEGFLGSFKDCVRALNGVDFKLEKGEILGVVGESGSGKTTLAKIICGLHEPTSGELIWHRDLKGRFKRAQMVFQNPYASLNPKLSIGYMLREALAAGSFKPLKKIKRDEIRKVLKDVGLEKINISAYPHQFSGGQKQRIGIARALALRPHVLVCDEPVSALDISVQAQIINLISKINREKNVSIIIIAHDIEVVSMISRRLIVMNRGEVVEEGLSGDIIKKPSKTYTKKLIEAIPRNPYIVKK